MIVIKLIEKLRSWQRDREAINTLLSCSDKELSDIGVMRFHITNAVKGKIRPNMN